jgi:predicted nucleic acid-binding protein
VTWLLDVNILVAWGWPDHPEHLRVCAWLREEMKSNHIRLATTPVTQVGFVRVSGQRSHGRITPATAGRTLRALLQALGEAHRFMADDQDGFEWPEWCGSASRTTDAHLVSLAGAHRARLATLDTSIPGAFVIP